MQIARRASSPHPRWPSRREWEAEGFAGEGHIEARDDDPLAHQYELKYERDDRTVEPLCLVKSNQVHLTENGKELFAQVRDMGDW